MIGVSYCVRMGHNLHGEDEEGVSLAERRAAQEDEEGLYLKPCVRCKGSRKGT